MLFAMHYEALKEALLTPETDNGIFSRSKLTITESILNEYNQKIASDPLLANYYYPFFQKVSNQLKILPKCEPQTNRSLLPDYILAANYGGKKLAICPKTQLDRQSNLDIQRTGIRLNTVSDLFSDTGKLGYEPFERYQLTHNSKSTPSLIEHFTCGEKYIKFYDKHINNDAISLINHLISKAANDAEIIIITSKNCTIPRNTIKDRITVKNKQTVRVEHADKSSTDRIHDRFIYIDKHYEIHIPRGLDVFGSPPNWTNKNAIIDAYDVYKQGNEVRITLEKNGNITPRPILIRSIVNT